MELGSIYKAEQLFHTKWEAFAGALDAVGWTRSETYHFGIGFNSTLANFCGGGTSGGVLPTMDTAVGCGAAPARTYTGVTGNTNNTGIWSDSPNGFGCAPKTCFFGSMDIEKDKLGNSLTANTFSAQAVGNPGGGVFTLTAGGPTSSAPDRSNQCAGSVTCKSIHTMCGKTGKWSASGGTMFSGGDLDPFILVITEQKELLQPPNDGQLDFCI